MKIEDLIMAIDNPHFTVRLRQSLLEVDLKDGAKKELEDLVEANSILRGSLGFLFQNIIPLDVPLKDIESVEQNEKGQVQIAIPHRRDIIIPLEPNDSEKLIDKLNELIPLEKQKERERMLASDRGDQIRHLKTLSRISSRYDASTQST